jgi:hypothetical protein
MVLAYQCADLAANKEDGVAMKPIIASPAIVVSTAVAVLTTGGLLLKVDLSAPDSGGLSIGLLIAATTAFPMVINAALGFFLRSGSSQKLLTFAAVLFGLLAAVWYVWTMVLHPGAQSGVGLIFTGLYLLPILLPLWVASFWKRHHRAAI